MGKGLYTMDKKEIVLCGASAYTAKFYLAPEFEGLPTQVKDELKIICVLFTEEVGGAITMTFDEDGYLIIETSSDEGDLLYDDIGAGLLVKKLRDSREDFFEALEMYYKVFILHEKIEDDEE